MKKCLKVAYGSEQCNTALNYNNEKGHLNELRTCKCVHESFKVK